MTGNALKLVTFLMNQDRSKLFDLKEHKERRSLNANAYFHVLCDRLRQYYGVTMSRQKNELISAYGQFEYINEQIVYIKTQIPPERMAEQEHLHCQYVKTVEGCHFYRVCRGSHTYNTAEMARLIDGTVEECKAAGIETLPPRELERIKQAWGKLKAKEESTTAARAPMQSAR